MNVIFQNKQFIVIMSFASREAVSKNEKQTNKTKRKSIQTIGVNTEQHQTPPQPKLEGDGGGGCRLGGSGRGRRCYLPPSPNLLTDAKQHGSADDPFPHTVDGSFLPHVHPDALCSRGLSRRPVGELDGALIVPFAGHMPPLVDSLVVINLLDPDGVGLCSIATELIVDVLDQAVVLPLVLDHHQPGVTACSFQTALDVQVIPSSRRLEKKYLIKLEK